MAGPLLGAVLRHWTKVLRFLMHMGVRAVSANTVSQHQTAFLQPAVRDVWQGWQDHYISTTRQMQKAVILGGDGRADLPGHCAKFGVYSLMDLTIMKISIIHLVQSNEVQNSSRMELEGLKRGVNLLQQSGIQIAELVTDRHPQVLKYVRENMPTTKQSVDVWHVSKGLKKKLVKLAREKDCGELTSWNRSINNHLYWVAASTPNSDRQLMQ
ncbi:uncharacterized protein [Littorina saxatilis]|uniref:uncharacterized protein n=1 Tax=Littorina saxatilis TaxID=31220 RepID=UPI0038B55E86